MLENYFTYKTRELYKDIIIYSDTVLTKPVGNYDVGTTFTAIEVDIFDNTVYLIRHQEELEIDKFKFNVTIEKLN